MMKLLAVFVLCAVASAQAPKSSPTVTTFADIRLGMAQSAVLAAMNNSTACGCRVVLVTAGHPEAGIDVFSTQGSGSKLGRVDFSNQLVSEIDNAEVNVNSLSSGALASLMIPKIIANCPKGSPGPPHGPVAGLLNLEGSAVIRPLSPGQSVSTLRLNCGANGSFYQLFITITPLGPGPQGGGITIQDIFSNFPPET